MKEKRFGLYFLTASSLIFAATNKSIPSCFLLLFSGIYLMAEAVSEMRGKSRDDG